MPTTAKPPAIPRHRTKTRKVTFWGEEYTITPAVVSGHLGDGKTLLMVQPLNTRPNYYLIRVDSAWSTKDGYDHDHIDEATDVIDDEFGEMEHERERLADDLREQGITPNGDNTDLAGNEDRLDWPVLSLDSGCCWNVVARWNGRKWA